MAITFLEVTPGTGARVTFDSDGAGTPQYTQGVKLITQTAGAITLAPGDVTNGLDVDVTRVIPGTAATELGKAEDAAHTTGDVGVAAMAVRSDTAAALGANNDYMPLIVDSTGKLHVNVGNASLAVTLAALPASTNTIEVVGDVAQDVAVAGNPVLVGLRASTAIPTAMSADGDSVYAWADRSGALIISSRPCATATLANVAGSATSVTLQASNTARKGLIIVNDSTSVCFVKFGSTASATSFTYKLQGGDILELRDDGNIYTGIVTGIWTTATGSARMTEITS